MATSSLAAPEGMAMTVNARPFANGRVSLIGFGARPRRSILRLVLLPAIAVAGCVGWIMLSGSRDAEGQSAPAAAPVLQNATWSNPAVPPTEPNLAPPQEGTALPETPAPAEVFTVERSPVDGLKISSQSWRRGGLGSKALVTFTLRNGNDYAVKDVEIACAFTRRDGSHLTDRTRTIHDTVTMKSQRTFARMHVGFVNVHADKAKCALLAASRL
jgi:hypothetical protein